MPRRHRQEDIYWNAAESDSDDCFRDYQRLPPPAKEPYIDPWDLENYAYIREHLDSMELSSNPSVPQSASSTGSGDFGETNSNSFCYVPGTKRLSERHMDANGDYADIEEVKYVSRRPVEKQRRNSRYEYEIEENPYEPGLSENSIFGIYDKTGRFRKVAVPVDTAYKTQLDRSLSSSYSYENYEYDPYVSRYDIYSRLDEMAPSANQTMPIYDDVRRLRKKPRNFGLTNYGHLKIDYSLSWNNLNRYIRYHS
ncbi:unnamed protein product [Ceutorhynchus assimilis]|uniref:Uncharacterized protein n=1 Tax=Ceutorhynchus assimilis TaxID=467358 RepID=A0A9N9MA73_9CUCU|nr:unnamed protein product [Ceutorhynchus assimilis]